MRTRNYNQNIFLIISMKKVKCSNPKCEEIFEINEIINPCINDRGYIVFKCRKCHTKTKVYVLNPDQIGYIKNADFENYYYIEDSHTTELEKIKEGKVLYINEQPKQNLCKWSPMNSQPFWINDKNLEEISTTAFNNVKENIENAMKALYHPYVKSKCNVEKSMILIHDKDGFAIWGKDIKSEKDLNSTKYYLIHHNSMSYNMIDGLYKRNTIKTYLERCLVRWKFLCNQVIIVTPFIGFDYNKKQKEENQNLWNLLNELLDMQKTTFITRKGTYNQLKKAQDFLNPNMDSSFLREWNLNTEIEKCADKGDFIFKQEFHAKFYAGIFDDHVEFLSGSFNIHTGKYLDSIYLRNCSLDFFKKRYLDPLIRDFKYSENTDENIHFLEIENNKIIHNQAKKKKELINQYITILK